MAELKQCFLCGKEGNKDIIEIYDYRLCTLCKSNLGLLQDNTIKKQSQAFEKRKSTNSELPTYDEEIVNKIEALDQHYIKSRIKLLHIQMRLKELL